MLSLPAELLPGLCMDPLVANHLRRVCHHLRGSIPAELFTRTAEWTWSSDYYYVEIVPTAHYITISGGISIGAEPYDPPPNLGKFHKYILVCNDVFCTLDAPGWLPAVNDLHDNIYKLYTESVGNPDSEDLMSTPQGMGPYDAIAYFELAAWNKNIFGTFRDIIRHGSGRYPVRIYRKLRLYHDFCPGKLKLQPR